MTPSPAPLFHHTSLPVPPLPPEPPRKLHTVMFSTHTSEACHTMMPLRPSALPLASVGPKFWSVLAVLQGAPDLVPSTMTLLRSMPMSHRPGLVMRTPAGGPTAAPVFGSVGTSYDVVL